MITLPFLRAAASAACKSRSSPNVELLPARNALDSVSLIGQLPIFSAPHLSQHVDSIAKASRRGLGGRTPVCGYRVVRY